MNLRCSLSQHNFTIPLLFRFALERSVWQSNGELKHLKLKLLNLYFFLLFHWARTKNTYAITVRNFKVYCFAVTFCVKRSQIAIMSE